MKAQTDIIFLAIIFVAISISFIITFFLYGNLTNALQPVLNPTNSINDTVGAVNNSVNTAFLTYGNLLVLVFFGIGIAAITSAFFVETQPIFFIISIFFLGIEIVASVILHNIFFTIAQQSSFISITQQFPTLIIIFQYYPEIVFVIALGIVIALYSK